nr:MAG TPA: hypothetical protein [Caudoviricetes sp.]
MSVFPDCQGKSSLRNPRVYLRILGVLQYMTHAQGFLNKLKQKDTPSNQLRRYATYRLSSEVPLCLRTVFAERPLLVPTDFNGPILLAFSLPLVHFRSPCLGAIHCRLVAPWLFGLLSFRSSSFLTIFRRTFKERLIDVCILARG